MGASKSKRMNEDTLFKFDVTSYRPEPDVDDDEVTNGMSTKAPRVLLLHGWRTSAKIMSMQTAAMRYHTGLKDCHFLTAPYPAEGPPDNGIAQFYPNHDYYEWYYKRTSSAGEANLVGLDRSLQRIIDYMNEQGPFDGIVGFSQGTNIATRLAHKQQTSPESFRHTFKFVILIGGVPPKDFENKVCWFDPVSVE